MSTKRCKGKSDRVGSDISQDALLNKKATEQRKFSDLKKFKCYYCKRRGHFAKDCFKRKSDEKQRQNQAEAHRIESIHNSDDDNNPEIALVIDHDLAQYNEWWIDSGASQHMTFDKNGLHKFIICKDPLKVKLADNSVLMAYGKGNIHLSVYDGTEKVDLHLNDVLYVPKLQNKLLSLPAMIAKGASVQFKGKLCELIVKDKHYSIGYKHGKL